MYIRLIAALVSLGFFVGCAKESLDMSLPAQIKTILHEQIDDHRGRYYNDLWTDFYETDAREDGTVQDLYASHTRYQFGLDQDRGGGDLYSYNREHSIPKSWSNYQTYEKNHAMYTDLFYLYPSDSYANTKRSNHPYGEVTGTIEWQNGYSKLGKGVVPGSSSATVFEPNDKVKGNLARSYFYFATRYEDEDFSDWPGTHMFAKNKYPFFKTWATSLLLKWHRLDPVDDAERARNEAIFKIQGNRNPYIDNPELVEYIWGDKKGEMYPF